MFVYLLEVVQESIQHPEKVGMVSEIEVSYHSVVAQENVEHVNHPRGLS